jgi:hypothetical protein
LGDGAIEIGPGNLFAVGNKKNLAIAFAAGRAQLDGLDEVVDIDGVADSAAGIQEAGDAFEELGGDARRPAGGP